ncbi:MAG: VCBS repeat-containing protein [Enhygromyxa sp.]
MKVRIAASLGIAALAGGLWACFDGIGTIGAICFADDQCGLEQRCVNSVCGLCNDRQIQPGELCFGTSRAENVFGEVSDLLAFDPEGDGFPLLAAVVNNNCAEPPMQGPPAFGGPSCWGLFVLTIEDDGDFETTTPLGTNQDGRVPQMAIGNFDGNSEFDLAIAIAPNDPLIDASIAVLHDFPSPQSFNVDISVTPRTLHAADLDGDGIDDLLVGGQTSSSLALLIATPGVGFANERLLVTDTTPRPAPPVDMDNDGDLDIVLVSQMGGTVGVNLNNGSGNFSPRNRLEVGEQLEPMDLVTADFDGDGFQDVVVFAPALPNSEAASEVVVYRNLGDGELEELVRLPGGELPITGLAADVNFDGWPDIVVADLGEDSLPVWINRGGSFPDVVQVNVAAAPRTLMREDFNFDHIPDLVVGSANGVIAVVPSEN